MAHLGYSSMFTLLFHLQPNHFPDTNPHHHLHHNLLS